MKIMFFGLEPWEQDYFKNHQELAGKNLEFLFVDDALDKHHIPPTTDAEIISVFVKSVVDGPVLDKFPNLKFIATRSTGYDHIDVAEAQKKNIAVSNVPFYGENTVAEHAFALLLCLSRKIYDGYHRVREEGSFRLDGLRGFDLKGKTIGIVGTGHIGRHAARMAKGFEMNIIAHDVKPDEKLASEVGLKYVPFETLLAESDIITLHVPYLKQTHHLLNKDNIRRIKKGAYIINTSRGAVIETEALVEALKYGHLAGAGLDVLEEEGAIQDELDLLVGGHPEEHNLKTVLANHVLIDMPNVIITPHNAFNTTEAIKRIFDTTAGNISQFIDGNPQNVVTK